MSQTKAQLIAPIGIVTAPRVVASGVITATTFVGDVSGNVTGITSNTDNLYVGILTATTFVGDFTGIADSITKGSNVVAGIITASKFVGNSTGTVVDLADDTNINVGIITATQFVGNSPGLSAGISAAKNINVGVLTATGGFYGSASAMTGVSVGPVSQQAVTADSANTTIDIGSGNLVYLNQSANTTIGLGTTGTTNELYIVRVKDSTDTARTITWPSTIVWGGGSAPTLVSSKKGGFNVFKLTTRDNGATWYGAGISTYDPAFTAGTLWGMGRNNYGAMAQNDTNSGYSSPVQIGSAETWTDITGYLAINSDGELWGWGRNEYAEAAQNNKTQYSSPVQVPGTTWSKLSEGKNSHLHAIKTDGTLWGWANNGQGQLGVNNKTDYSSPVQIPGTTWAEVAHGNQNSLFRKTDGTLWSCGQNVGGILGLNQPTATYVSSPTQIPGTTWSKIAAWGAARGGGIKTDGTLWTWGSGPTGDGEDSSYSSPKQVPGTDWSDLAPYDSGWHAIRTDGTLWAWGSNASGDLGQNDRTQRSSPIQIPGTTWNGVFSAQQSYATKTDNTAWSWGYAGYGQLGHNQGGPVRYSSPVQLPGSWEEFATDGYRAWGIKYP